jgi:hypothetical protein
LQIFVSYIFHDFWRLLPIVFETFWLFWGLSKNHGENGRETMAFRRQNGHFAICVTILYDRMLNDLPEGNVNRLSHQEIVVLTPPSHFFKKSSP